MELPSVRSLVKKQMRRAAVLGAAAVLLQVQAVAGFVITGGNGQDTWDPETGQSIPSGTAGILNGTLKVETAGYYSFTYGAGILSGDTGHGNTIYMNEFWVGADEASAETAGNVFCTLSGDASCSGVATVGDSFTVYLSAGAIPFGFTFAPGHTSTLLNGQTDNTIGSYLAAVGLATTAFEGPGGVAYLGLSDRPYPGTDHDFQDLVVTVQGAPEPISLTLTGLGLVAVALSRRRTAR